MRVLILEDNNTQRDMLEKIISQRFNPRLIELCSNADELSDALKKSAYDVLLLDIEIGEDNSIDYMEKIIGEYPGINSKIIFITAHKKYAMDAINKTHCFGYLIKPYDEEKLSGTITSLIGCSDKEQGKIDFFSFKIKGDVHFVNKEHILFFEIQNKKPILYTRNDTFYLPRTTVASLMDKLNNDSKKSFIRCRRDNIVNLHQIAHIKRQGSINFVVLNNGVKVPIGEKYKDDLFNRLRI